MRRQQRCGRRWTGAPPARRPWRRSPPRRAPSWPPTSRCAALAIKLTRRLQQGILQGLSGDDPGHVCVDKLSNCSILVIYEGALCKTCHDSSLAPALRRQSYNQLSVWTQSLHTMSGCHRSVAFHFVLQLKKAAASSDAVLVGAAGEHLPAAERPFCWLGTVRPSDACAGLAAALGSSLEPPHLQALEQLKVLSPHPSLVQ